MQKNWEIDDTSISLCRNKEAWSGSSYELSMAYSSETFKKQDHLHMMQRLWNTSSLQGVVKSPDQFGQQWQPIDSSFLIQGLHSYGYIHFPTGQIVGCGNVYTTSEGVIWSILYIPLGMLNLIFPVHYPVTREKNPWISKVDKFLGMIGNWVYQDSPFLLAVMGEEATAFPLKSILATITHDPGLLVPKTTFQRIGVNPYGVCLSEDLWWTGGKKIK